MLSHSSCSAVDWRACRLSVFVSAVLPSLLLRGVAAAACCLLRSSLLGIIMHNEFVSLTLYELKLGWSSFLLDLLDFS